MEVIADNERLALESNTIRQELREERERVIKSQLKEKSLQEVYQHKFLLEQRVKELETENDKLCREKMELKVKTSLDEDKLKLFENSISDLERENAWLKSTQADEMNRVESRTEDLTEELSRMRTENNKLKGNEERKDNEVRRLETLVKESGSEIQSLAAKNKYLNEKVVDIEKELLLLIEEKRAELENLAREEDRRQRTREQNQSLIKEMSRRIQEMKRERSSKRIF